MIYNVCRWLKKQTKKKHILQGSVSKHDTIEGQSSGDGLLLDELYEGEARRLSLVSSHSHKLNISHLLEELQQLLCSGGLCKERLPTFNDNMFVTTESKALTRTEAALFRL